MNRKQTAVHSEGGELCLRFSALCTMLLFVAFTPSKTHADPTVITGGTLTVTGLIGGPRYTFSGNNFSAGGGGERRALGLQSRVVFTSGSVVDVGATFAGSSLDFNYPTMIRRCCCARARVNTGLTAADALTWCSVDFDAPSRCLKCRYHQEAYARVGHVMFGPPRRPLDELVLQVRAGGHISNAPSLTVDLFENSY